MSMPSKLFDYLSVGLPVVANEVGGWTDIVKANRVGVVTRDDPEDFARGILELVNDHEEAIECGRRGLEIIRTRYNWDVSASTLKSNYEKLCRNA